MNNKKINVFLADILFLLYNVEDKIDYKIEELEQAINLIQNFKGVENNGK